MNPDREKRLRLDEMLMVVALGGLFAAELVLAGAFVTYYFFLTPEFQQSVLVRAILAVGTLFAWVVIFYVMDMAADEMIDEFQDD